MLDRWTDVFHLHPPILRFATYQQSVRVDLPMINSSQQIRIAQRSHLLRSTDPSALHIEPITTHHPSPGIFQKSCRVRFNSFSDLARQMRNTSLSGLVSHKTAAKCNRFTIFPWEFLRRSLDSVVTQSRQQGGLEVMRAGYQRPVLRSAATIRWASALIP